MSTLRKKNHGQSLVEFMLVLPILALLFFVILDLGRAVYYYSVIYNAACEGARYGIIWPDDYTGIQDRVNNYSIGLDPTDITVITSTAADADGNLIITVAVNYDFTAATPFLSVFMGSSQFPINSRSSMRIEE